MIEFGGRSHHDLLEVKAVESLARGDYNSAYRFADRRCRIHPTPKAHSYVLRAEALSGLGDDSAAVRDLIRALEIAPDDIATNRRMLRLGTRAQQKDAALSLTKFDTNVGTLRNALAVLCEYGITRFAHVLIFIDSIQGWAVWDSSDLLEIRLDDGANRMSHFVAPDPLHPLRSDQLNAAAIHIPRPRSNRAQIVSLLVNNKEFHVLTAAANIVAKQQTSYPTDAFNGNMVTVIVPVYADYDVTVACVDRIRREVEHSGQHRLIIVNDATPDERIAEYINRVRTSDRLTVLVNEFNMGFVGSVNRAIASIPNGDVILLNSDTIVPAGFIERLLAVAHSAESIGTVTPLSNNGEFTSFPMPYKNNPLGSEDEIACFDLAAKQVNTNVVIDMPNGVGFCLYVTWRCLRAVGGLLEIYHRGYFEDVDLCLRARAHGFRNVCAAGVFVGHAGSRSFGKEKQSLIVRNFQILERRFPNYEWECGAFLSADPLQSSRQAIERALPPRRDHARAIVAGTGSVGIIAKERAKILSADGVPTLCLEVKLGGSGPVITVRDPTGKVPQSLRFAISSEHELRLLVDYLTACKLVRIEIVDPRNIPSAFMQAMLSLNVPYNFLIADAGLICPRDIQFDAAMLSSSSSPVVEQFGVGADWRRYWRKVAESADNFLVPCRQAEAFVSQLFPGRVYSRVETFRSQRETTLASSTAGRSKLAFVPLRGAARDYMAMRDIVHEFNCLQTYISIIIAGKTIDDESLMQVHRVFVTGSVDASELSELINRYDIAALFPFSAQPLFGHPMMLAAEAMRLPLAYFDWSGGQCKASPRELAIDPRLSSKCIAALLAQWIGSAA